MCLLCRRTARAAAMKLYAWTVKRIVQEAREAGRLIDATYRRKTRAVIIMDSGHVVLSALQPETAANRMSGGIKENVE